MTEGHAGAWTRTSRIIKARPEELYEAFIDPAALIAWLPPAEMTGAIHEFEARVGGGYRMSLFYPPHERTFRGKTSDKEDMVNVRFVRVGDVGSKTPYVFACLALICLPCACARRTARMSAPAAANFRGTLLATSCGSASIR